MSQYAELKAQIAKLQAQADDARRTEVGNVIAEIRQKIAEYGLSAHDLGFAEAARR
ncbi:MAG TPA: H-NS histone family protein, partial [Trinickia sp.]|nr:H-NS histone family protein [Trinickia sp.]